MSKLIRTFSSGMKPMNLKENSIKSNLYTIICKLIKNNLTIGKEENGEISYKDDEITNFINFNKKLINNCIDEIFNDYKNDNDLESLENPEDGWINEYLENYIEYN